MNIIAERNERVPCWFCDGGKEIPVGACPSCKGTGKMVKRIVYYNDGTRQQIVDGHAFPRQCNKCGCVVVRGKCAFCDSEKLSEEAMGEEENMDRTTCGYCKKPITKNMTATTRKVNGKMCLVHQACQGEDAR